MNVDCHMDLLSVGAKFRCESHGSLIISSEINTIRYQDLDSFSHLVIVTMTFLTSLNTQI